MLKNVAKLQENANAAYAALYDAPESASSQIRVALKKLEDLSRIDGSLLPILDTLKPAAIGVDEVSSAMRDYLDRLEADPTRLEEVESRLAAIDRLKRKYGSSLDEVLAFLANVRSQLEAIETAGDRRVKLEQQMAQASEAYRAAAAALTERRKAAAEKLAEKVSQGTRFAGARKRDLPD